MVLGSRAVPGSACLAKRAVGSGRGGWPARGSLTGAHTEGLAHRGRVLGRPASGPTAVPRTLHSTVLEVQVHSRWLLQGAAYRIEVVQRCSRASAVPASRSTSAMATWAPPLAFVDRGDLQRSRSRLRATGCRRAAGVAGLGLATGSRAHSETGSGPEHRTPLLGAARVRSSGAHCVRPKRPPEQPSAETAPSGTISPPTHESDIALPGKRSTQYRRRHGGERGQGWVRRA